MSNATQTYKLYEVLKSGEPVAVTKIAEELKIKLLSVPVYIHGLKKAKAEINAIREGRKVVSYQMVNSSEVKVAEFRKNSADAQKAAKASAPKTIETRGLLDETKIDDSVSEKEIADLRLALDVEGGYGSLAD